MAIGSIWAGSDKLHCDICRQPIQRTFVDGVASSGSWAIMCPTCRISEGRIRLGTGLGQKYERQGDNYVRTA